MAYQGRKVFQAGEVLTASDLNSTVDQTVMVFTDGTARDTAIPTPVEGMICYLESDNSVLKYDGSNWVSVALDINLDADRAVITNAGGDLVVSDVTATELGFLDGVTSNVQTQLNDKQDDLITTQGDLIIGDASGDATRLAIGSAETVLTSDGTTASWVAGGAGGAESFFILPYQELATIDVDFQIGDIVRFAIISTSTSAFNVTLLDSSGDNVDVVTVDRDNPFTYYITTTAVATIQSYQDVIDEEAILIFSDPTAVKDPDVKNTIVITSTQSITLASDFTAYCFGGGAGGGGIGNKRGAGAGGGGSGFFTTGTVTAGTYTATIGAGGAGGVGGADGSAGGTTSIGPVTANGGSPGLQAQGLETAGAGGDGGSGGGGAKEGDFESGGGDGGSNGGNGQNEDGGGGTGSGVQVTTTIVNTFQPAGQGGESNFNNTQDPAGFYAGGAGGAITDKPSFGAGSNGANATGFAGGGNGAIGVDQESTTRNGGSGFDGYILLVEV